MASENNHYHYCVKLLMLGDSSVGKTSLLNRFHEGNWNPNINTTIGLEFKIKTIQVEDKYLKLLVWDTSGQEKYCALAKNYYQYT